MFAIEAGHPIGRYGRNRYPFAEMQPGESFFVPASTVPDRINVRHAAAVFKRRHPGWDYTTRVSLDPSNPGIRIWRLRGAPESTKRHGVY